MPLEHAGEAASNAARSCLARVEPRCLRTFTPTQVVIEKSAGVFHWTPEGRRLFDFTSGVLVANLGHNPTRWTRRFFDYMGWTAEGVKSSDPYFPAVAMTTYNAVTPIEVEASRQLVAVLQESKGGGRLEQVMWAASGSEAIQKALWAAMARDKARPMILAPRFGFHGKKGLANAVTGSETDAERDPRVKFFGFPMHECRDVSVRDAAFDPAPYRAELDALLHQYGRRFGCLITEPYLGGGGSYHPAKAYHQMLEAFCREHDIAFIFDEVQANFGRTGHLFAFETYGIEPDMVVLGKGLGNGVPVAAAVGRADIFAALDYGEGSDTWSANPLNCASVLATLDEFAADDVLGKARESSAILENGLVRLKRFPFVSAVRGEKGGMVWGIEFQEYAGKSAPDWANHFVLAAYQGDGPESDGIHLLGPLSKKVVRVSPPLVITPAEVVTSLGILDRAAARMAGEVPSALPVAAAV
jgi:4-aminobutyrate aminotransferase-like enzyme